MLSKQELSSLRGKLFRHLDGIVIAPSACSLHQQGVTDFLLTRGKATLEELTKEFKANDGYLNVALRGLCSQGWLSQQVDNEQNVVTFETNTASEIAFSHFHLYEEAVDLMKMSGQYHARKFEMEPFIKLENLFGKYQNQFGLSKATDEATQTIREQILTHIEGVMVGPTLVHLGMTGMFHQYFMETRFRAEEFHKDYHGFGRLLDMLVGLGWFNVVNDAYEFTDVGLFFAKRASSYGVTVSYIPNLRKLDDLIFGNALVLKAPSADGEEQHVDRAMNVWGSGGAHGAYFKVVDEIIIDLFNKPIDEQPKGILDMGCGNGAFLKHLFSVIENHSHRGTILDEYPLQIIGVDYNEAALKVSRENLVQADIWAKIIWGDIGDPDRLVSDLKDKYKIELKDLLNVRTFLDHNRVWNEPSEVTELRLSTSTGAYVHRGERKPNNLVAESLKQHIRKWTPYVEKFGLLLIELHTVKPELIAGSLGRTAATAYDLTHGYSDQYILEVDEFLQAVEDAGLVTDKQKFRKYPNSDLATVSINLFKAEA